MGADTILRWNAPFYDAVCAASFSADTCKEAYAEQPENIQAALMGVVVQQANADCPECKYYLDLPLAERSVSLFADTLLANATFVKRVIQLRRQTVENIAYEDLWKFTLTSYNAGPGCFANAFSTLVDNQNRLNWENLSRQLEPGCRGVVSYVDFISSTNSYYPERDPSSLPPPLPPNKRTPTPGGGIETPVLTSTVSITDLTRGSDPLPRLPPRPSARPPQEAIRLSRRPRPLRWIALPPRRPLQQDFHPHPHRAKYHPHSHWAGYHSDAFPHWPGSHSYPDAYWAGYHTKSFSHWVGYHPHSHTHRGGCQTHCHAH